MTGGTSASADARWMARALQLAERGRTGTHPNPRVGCVLVHGDIVVGEGWHQRAGEPHAEVHALRMAGARARGATAYVTLEPCSHHGRTPPCADALIDAGVAEVVVALEDPNPEVAGRGLRRLSEAGVKVRLGCLEGPARALNRGFLSRMQRGRPWLTVKLAASLDGRTALANGASQWITGEAARADVHRQRAEAGAVMVGAATVLADNPRLNVRPPAQTQRPPDRIVLDTRGEVPAGARVWSDDGARRIWITSGDHAAPAGVEHWELPRAADGRLDLASVLTRLGAAGVNHVLAEPGPRLAGTLLSQRLADELVVYLAPQLLGDAARGLAALPALAQLDQAPRLRWTDVRQVGADLRLTAAFT